MAEHDAPENKLHLSPRQIQLVRGIVQGKSNKAIAFDLNIGHGTVKEYLFRLYRKVGVTNRTELAVWALKEGL